MVYQALLVTLALGGEPSGPPENTPIEVYDGVKVTPEQIQDVKSKAKQAFAGEIERIYVGQLVHPFANNGFRVHFKGEVVGTYVIEREFALEIPRKKPEKSDSAKATGAASGMVLHPDLVPRGVRTSITRLFPLKTVQLRLKLPDDLSYGQALALLQAIESRTYRMRPEKPNTREGFNRTAPIDMSKISSLRYYQESQTIEVNTNEWRWGGMVYRFAVLPDGFELILVLNWVT